MPQLFSTESATFAMFNATVSTIMEKDVFDFVDARNPRFPPGKYQTIPRALPPGHDAAGSSPGAPNSLLTSVMVPVFSVFFLVLLSVTAYKSWRYYRGQSNKPSGHENNFDPEAAFEEQEPLKLSRKFDNQNTNMQIIQESDKKEKSGKEEPAESNVTTETLEASPSHQPTVVSFAGVERKDSKDETHTKVIVEEIRERPSTLKFLAASAAFQASTVPALQRLPYTPDPDCALCEVRDSIESHQAADAECEDKVAPLALPATKTKRMKPRGLLERRGSNVALTISLRSGEKNNNTTTITSTKSPKPLAYLQRASCPLTPNELHAKSCDPAALQKEFWEIPMNHPSEKHFNIAGHGTKNRYRTILPNEHSRVKLPLTPGEDPLSTYINANYIRDCTSVPFPSSTPEEEPVNIPVNRKNASFIATQGPMANTVTDFWRMIWQEHVSSIIMITKLKERKEKCTQYLPIEVEDTLSFDDITIKVTSVKKQDFFTVRSLEVTHEGETRKAMHFWYTTWMDHETPEKTRGLLELVQEVSMWNKPFHGPLVVHCSAGIGRTGCYIAVTVGCQQLMKTQKTDILRIVSQMRLDRGGMVQTWEQYQFVHQALSRYGRILAGENVTTPSTTGSIRSPPDLMSKLTSPGPLSQETSRPHTPKHRRSLSAANLPSPKELKLNLKNGPAQQQCNSVSKQNAPASSHSLKQRKLKIQLPKSESPSAIPLRADKSTSVVTSSPTIRSPFDRMCLQSRDMNAASSPVTNGKFDWPENSAAASGKASYVSPMSQTKSKKNFDFNFVVPNAPADAETKPALTNGSEKHQLSYDFPNVGKLSNGECHTGSKPALQNRKTSPGNSASGSPTSPAATAKSSHFVFPLPDER